MHKVLFLLWIAAISTGYGDASAGNFAMHHISLIKASLAKLFLNRSNHMRKGSAVLQSSSNESQPEDRKAYLRALTESHLIEITEDHNNWTSFRDDWYPSVDTYEIIPNPNACLHRPVHWHLDGYYAQPHVYANFSSLKQFQHANGTTKKFTWLQAKNICRRYCMNLIGLEEEYEWELLKMKLENAGRELVWTSGRVCDYDGCEGNKHLLPLIVNGWSWSDSQTSLKPTNTTPPDWLAQPWFQGQYGQVSVQPDNLDRDVYGNGEQCLAVFKSAVFAGTPAWFDMLCSMTGHVVCEESPQLLRMADERWPHYQLLNTWPSR